jgi:hypothetical protein
MRGLIDLDIAQRQALFGERGPDPAQRGRGR